MIGVASCDGVPHAHRTSDAARHTRARLYARSLLAHLHMEFSLTAECCHRVRASTVRADKLQVDGLRKDAVVDVVADIAERVTTCEGGVGAGCYAGSGESVAILVHGAGKPVRCADIGGALPIGDLRALHRRDGPVGSHGKEGLGPIPEVTCSGRRRFWPCAARRDVNKAPARGLHRLEVVAEKEQGGRRMLE